MKQLATFLLMLSSLALFSQPIYYVTPSGNDNNDGTTWTTAFKTLQRALTGTSSRQVWVAAGTYYPDESPFIMDNDRYASFEIKTGFAIYGGFSGNETDTSQRNWNTNITILSGDIDQVFGIEGNACIVVRGVRADNTAILDGFTITGGNADDPDPTSEWNKGGGINLYNSSPVIINCSFTRNKATEGGGVYITGNSSPTFFNCSVSGNTAENGGGMFSNAVSPAITSCSFTENHASLDGGGILISTNGSAILVTDCDITRNIAERYGGGLNGGSLTITNCRIWNNEAWEAGGGIIGGGMVSNCSFQGNWAKYFGGAIDGASSVIDCSFTKNTALLLGGAIYNASTIIGCSFSLNLAGTAGDAIYIGGGIPYPFRWPGNNFDREPTVEDIESASKNNNIATNIVNCSFWKNQKGSGIFNYDQSLIITNCSFAEGSSVSDYGFSAKSTVTNCIFWNSMLSIYGVVTYSIVYLGFELDSTNLIDVDPLFVDEANGDLRLHPGSPAIDAGSNAAVTTTTDADGNPRIAGTRVDMGAYEYSPPPAPIELTCPAIETPILKNAGSEGCVYTIHGNELDVLVGGSSLGPFTYSYTLNGATTTTGPVVSSSLDGVSLNKGETTIYWLVRDTGANEANCSFKVMVVDSTPPVISGVTVNTPVLFPTDLKMQDITLEYTTSDNCGPVTTTLSVSSNEPENNHPPHPGFVKHGVIFGDGNTVPDWQVIDDHHLKLNTKNSIRSGKRVYTITITATDAAGNTSTAAVTVSAPRHTRANVFTDLVITARPNPSTNNFSLVTHSSSEQPMKIKVVDNVGRVIERRSGVSPAGTFYLGSTYKPGVYFVEIIQGATVKTLKLVKQAR